MASVLQLDYPSARPHHPVGTHRQPRPRSARRPPARAVFRRRRLCAALLGLGLVLTMARAAVAFDGSTLAAVSVVLVMTAIAACVQPARRALAVDPIIALKER